MLILLAAVGLIGFLIIASSGSFSDNLFATLYPKKNSFASEPYSQGSYNISNPYTQSSYYFQAKYYSQATYATPTPSPITTGSTIKIYAAGTPANRVFPTMQLLLNGHLAKSFSNVSGNPSIRPYAEYSFTIPVAVKVTPDQVRVAFVNDQYSGPNNDRNLFVDKINIDGVDYETERSTTYSTGSWSISKKNCAPGFFQTEALVCNGFFEYR